MNEVLVGVFLTMFFGWASWVSITVIDILRKLDMILYKVDRRNINEKSGVSL